MRSSKLVFSSINSTKRVIHTESDRNLWMLGSNMLLRIIPEWQNLCHKESEERQKEWLVIDK